MKVEEFFEVLNSDFYVGVPDSQLKALCDFLLSTFGVDGNHHIIAANEGNAVGIAAGYYLSTGKIPVVYMQNSGEGNAINPIASLLNEKVYGIPCIFVIGWRGEPGIHDEPQHLFQGEITTSLLEILNIEYMIIDSTTQNKDVMEKMKYFKQLLNKGKQVGFVVRKGTFVNNQSNDYVNKFTLIREKVIHHIINYCDDGFIVSTTGKTSRELFEAREYKGMTHDHDFLTVGSMGHSSSIGLGIALQRPDRKIWIIDGDGAILMHMGSLAVIASRHPSNIVHIVINNCAHESVGGQPTVMNDVDVIKLAEACGYKKAVSVDNIIDLDKVLEEAKRGVELMLIEVRTAIGSRTDLGRPTVSARENMHDFMNKIIN